MNETKHISEVCKLLHTTSRTIRYYEQLGLIRAVRESRSGPRRLDSESIEQLRKILFLRQIGLSLDEILEIVRDGKDAPELLRSKTVEFRAEIAAIRRRLRLLEMVIKAAENGDDIYSLEPEAEIASEDPVRCKIAAQCVQYLLNSQFDALFPLLHPKIRSTVTPELFANSWREFTGRCGAFRETGRQLTEGNLIKNLLHFEKTDAVVSVIFSDDLVIGIFIEYWNEKEHPYVSTISIGAN